MISRSKGALWGGTLEPAMGIEKDFHDSKASMISRGKGESKPSGTVKKTKSMAILSFL